MIFRRNSKRADGPEPESAASDEVVPEEPGTAGDGDPAPGDEVEEGAEPELDLDALDARDWRSEGPYDVSEVEDLTGTPEAPRIDLGAMVLVGFPGAELRLQMSEETQQIVSAMLVHEESALEIGAFAAPRSGGLWSELREDMLTAAIDAGGSASLAEGPFGVELRRFIPVTTPDGQQGYQPSRMWVAEGPRWLLRGIVYGPAALEEGVDPPVADLLHAFRQVVVRRGDEAMAPGDLLSLSMPQNLVVEDEDEPEA